MAKPRENLVKERLREQKKRIKNWSVLITCAVIFSCSISKVASDGDVIIGSNEYKKYTTELKVGTRIYGIVRSKEDSSPIPNAGVSLKGTDIYMLTSKDGKFEFLVDYKNYTILVNAAGFSDFKSKTIKLNKQEEAELKISLGVSKIY